MKPCEHPEESVKFVFDTSEFSAEHAEWCSICGAYRVVTGNNNDPWTVPKANDTESKQLRAALKKFGRHPTGDMEGVGRCAGFRKAAPFRDDRCDCGLNDALAGVSVDPAADERPKWLPPEELLSVSQQVNVVLRDTLDRMDTDK